MGARFLLLLLVMAFAAFNTQNNLIYLVFSLGLATMMAAAASAILLLRRIEVATGEVGDLYAGTLSTEHFRVRNRSRWVDAFGIEIEDLDFPGRAPRGSLPRLDRGGTTDLSLEKTYPRRGIIRSERLRIGTAFPFGLFRVARTVRLARQLIVFPQVHKVAISFVFRERPGQALQRPYRGDSEELRRLRDYGAGDSFHHIHWKASAKLGHLMVREFASEQQARFTIVLDNSGLLPGNGEDEAFEAAVSAAASLACHLSDHRLPFRFISGDEVFPHECSPPHLRGVLSHLAVVEPNPRPRHDLLDWAGEALRTRDVVLVLPPRAGARWSMLSAPGLHLVDAGAVVLKEGPASV